MVWSVRTIAHDTDTGLVSISVVEHSAVCPQDEKLLRSIHSWKVDYEAITKKAATTVFPYWTQDLLSVEEINAKCDAFHESFDRLGDIVKKSRHGKKVSVVLKNKSNWLVPPLDVASCQLDPGVCDCFSAFWENVGSNIHAEIQGALPAQFYDHL
jgi:hypothetical protein